MPIKEFSETKDALGGPITVSFYSDVAPRHADALFHEIWRRVYNFERKFSRFLPQSELTAFNKAAGLRLPISAEFKDILIKAKAMSLQTDGLYNPFILPALQRAGYTQSAALGYEHDPQENYTDRQMVPADQLIIQDDWASIPYGTALDLGGCGKGYLADQLAARLNLEPITGYWLSLSGDIAIGGTDAHGNSLSVSIQSAQDPASSSDWVIHTPIKHSGIATSGTFKRKNQQGQPSGHHIIDPKTGNSAMTDIQLATVCADTAFEADILASCAIILGSKNAMQFLKKQGVTSALLQGRDSNNISYEKHSGTLIHKLDDAITSKEKGRQYA